MSGFLGGFSPRNAIGQVGSYVGITPRMDYDVFTNKGSQQSNNESYRDPTEPTAQYPDSYYPQWEGSIMQAAQQGGGNDTTTSTTGGGTSYAQPQINTQELALFDQSINQANAGLGRLDNQKGIGAANIATDYKSALDRLLNSRNRTQSQYEGTKIENTQDNISNRSDIDFATGQRINALKRLLGSRGAGSSSASRVAAPYAAALEGSQQLRQVGDTFEENMGALDTGFSNYMTDWNQSKEDLETKKRNQEQALNQGYSSNRANILSTLAQLQGQRAQVAGGDVAAAAQPYLDQVNQMYSQADNFGRQFAGKVNVADPRYVAPDLSEYQYDPRQAMQLGGPVGGAGQQAASPYLASLLNPQRRREQQGIGA